MQRLMPSISRRFFAFINTKDGQKPKRIIKESMNFQLFSIKFYAINVNSSHLHFCVYTPYSFSQTIKQSIRNEFNYEEHEYMNMDLNYCTAVSTSPKL